VRVISVTAPRRFAGVLADVPTWREQGFDAVVSNWRALIGPRGMTEAQIAYWEGVIRWVLDTADWKHELELNFWNSAFMGSNELRKHMARDNEGVKAFLAELGLAR
jgi:putative tricarboxylic transport membrane protein